MAALAVRGDEKRRHRLAAFVVDNLAQSGSDRLHYATSTFLVNTEESLSLSCSGVRCDGRTKLRPFLWYILAVIFGVTGRSRIGGGVAMVTVMGLFALRCSPRRLTSAQSSWSDANASLADGPDLRRSWHRLQTNAVARRHRHRHHFSARIII